MEKKESDNKSYRTTSSKDIEADCVKTEILYKEVGDYCKSIGNMKNDQCGYIIDFDLVKENDIEQISEDSFIGCNLDIICDNCHMLYDSTFLKCLEKNETIIFSSEITQIYIKTEQKVKRILVLTEKNLYNVVEPSLINKFTCFMCRCYKIINKVPLKKIEFIIWSDLTSDFIISAPQICDIQFNSDNRKDIITHLNGLRERISPAVKTPLKFRIKLLKDFKIYIFKFVNGKGKKTKNANRKRLNVKDLKDFDEFRKDYLKKPKDCGSIDVNVRDFRFLWKLSSCCKSPNKIIY